MKRVMELRPRTTHRQPESWPFRRREDLRALVLGLAIPALTIVTASAILGGLHLPAQTRTAARPQASATEALEPRRGAPAQTHEAVLASAITLPASVRFAEQPPKQARVTWDSRGLEIEAYDSSLDQILRQVAADTGAKLEGLTQVRFQDERIFGTYGPGLGCDVLSKLLEGSGMNVLMTDSRDDGVPLKIVLSARLPLSSRAAADRPSRSGVQPDTAKQPEPEPTPDNAPGQPNPARSQDPFANGGPPRDPLELMQEILQRQQQIDQQQQQDGQHRPQQ